jgi:hypothetical protein
VKATILVSGLPRSGTSLMMQMLHAGGLEPVTDAIRGADEDNPRGYYELEAVKNRGDFSWLERSSGRAVKLIAELLLSLPEGGPYKVIFMRRRLDEVLASQKKMLERRGEPVTTGGDDEALKSTFVGHLEEVESFLRRRGDIETLFVSYNRLIEDPERQAARVAGFLGGELDVRAMAAAVDPDLYRNRTGPAA